MLYLGQSWRFFELRPGLVWPDGSWAFSKLLGNETTRLLASGDHGGIGLLINIALLTFIVRWSDFEF